MADIILPTLLEEFAEKLSAAKNGIPRQVSFPKALT